MDKPISLTDKSGKRSAESRILTAARQEFIEHGLKGARMQSIADRCGVNKALLHYYFRSKALLYQAVFRDIMQTMKGALNAHLGDIALDDDFRSVMRGFITVYITTRRDNPEFPRFILREIVEGGGNMPKIIEMLAPAIQDVPHRVNRLLMKEMNAGTIKRIEPLHLMLNLLGMCIFTFIAQPIITEIDRQMHTGINFGAAFFDARIESILDLVLNGVCLGKPDEKGGE